MVWLPAPLWRKDFDGEGQPVVKLEPACLMTETCRSPEVIQKETGDPPINPAPHFRGWGSRHLAATFSNSFFASFPLMGAAEEYASSVQTRTFCHLMWDMNMAGAHCTSNPMGHRLLSGSCGAFSAGMGLTWARNYVRSWAEHIWHWFLIIMPVARGTRDSHTDDPVWSVRSGLISSLVLTTQSDWLGGDASIRWHCLNQSE